MLCIELYVFYMHELISACIHKPKPSIICVIYMPTNSNGTYYNSLINYLTELCKKILIGMAILICQTLTGYIEWHIFNFKQIFVIYCSN